MQRPKAAKRLGSFWNRRKTVGALEREADGFGPQQFLNVEMTLAL